MTVARFCAALGVSMLLGARTLLAEDLTIGGLTFPVERIQHIGADQVSVTVRGRESLVPREKLHDHVVAVWLSDPEALASLQVNGIAELFERSLTEKLPERAALALRALAMHPSADPATVRRCAAGLEDGDESVRLLADASSGSGVRIDSRAVLLVELAARDPVWTRMHAASFFYTHQSEVREASTERFVSLMRAGEWKRVDSLIQLLSEIYGANNSFPRRLLAIAHRGRDIKAAADAASLERLFPLVDLSASDELTARALEPLIIGVLHEFAGKAIAAGTPGQAAAMLSRVKPEWRTPTTLELARKTLESAAEGYPGMDDPAFLAFFKQLSAGDPSIRERYAAALERYFEDAVRSENLARARAAQAELAALMPEDEAGADRRKTRLAAALAGAGRTAEAAEVLATVRGSVRLGDRLSLLASGYYFDLRWLVIVFGIPLVTALLYSMLEKRKTAALEREARAAIEAAATAEGVRTFYTKQTSPVTTGEGINPILSEYTKSLRILGLRPGASLQDVKSAYRALVKGAHPDAQGEEAGKASDRFIHITGAYDRILELRKKLKIDM